jgi:uncharacterized protein (TIGR01777 family)
MVDQRLTRRSEVAVSVEELFAWHERPGAFERLTPPWEATEVVRTDGSLQAGAQVVLRTRLAGPIAPSWVAEHVEYDPPNAFRDVQRRGPFALWDHTHRFEALGPNRSALIDEVRYRLPLGALGEAVAGRIVRARLERMFDYRHRTTIADLQTHARTKGSATMHIAVTGSTGLLGNALVAFLRTGGHTVTRITRSGPTAADELRWDIDRGEIDVAGLRGVDSVVHLAGEGIAEKRWTDEQKRRILTSRTEGTRLIAETLAAMDDGPRVLVSASAVGIYGERGDEVLTEDSGPGQGFLPDVVKAWEAAADPARAAGIRVVHPRIGIVQTPDGGALGKVLPLFRAGIGGKLGSGGQYWSWVSRDDVIGLIQFALTDGDLEGPVNAVAPNPVTNAEYTKVLGCVLKRPTVLPVPRFAPGILLGAELAENLVFTSARILPARAEKAGYSFKHTTLEACLRDILGRPA